MITIVDLKDLGFSSVKQNWNRQKKLQRTSEQSEKNFNRKEQEERAKKTMCAQALARLKIQFSRI